MGQGIPDFDFGEIKAKLTMPKNMMQLVASDCDILKYFYPVTFYYIGLIQNIN